MEMVKWIGDSEDSRKLREAIFTDFANNMLREMEPDIAYLRWMMDTMAKGMAYDSIKSGIVAPPESAPED